MNSFSPEDFFDLTDKDAAGLFKDIVNVWDAVAALPAFIEKVMRPEVLGEIEEGAWLEPGRVQVGKGSRIERGAIVRGQTIIGRRSLIFPQCSISGYFPNDSVVRPTSATYDVVPRAKKNSS